MSGVWGREGGREMGEAGSRKKESDDPTEKQQQQNRFRNLTPHFAGSISGTCLDEPSAPAGDEMDTRTRGGVMRRSSLVLCVVVSLCICGAIASAQEITGSIGGTGSDSSGSAV